ncbi:flavin-dependent oxidoreductase [Rhodophyticola sp. CCM32]|uniref:flavin-dependent oxidoreductase n=1 Tax=Rhodophyticola sp. CCM32 TaxID=2916397 RepID=UPI00107F6BCB|nr:flavin-dependent oxidoreductase [Rhodophyticola sp. CCM32]QBY00461.1 flavin-dependent oxidoreductase [Rhodophyticola sp. CCM32]
MTVLIAGAGIGGLTLGLSLHQQGIPFHIVEAVEKLRPMGVGINLQPHAVRELFELGLEPELDAIGLRTEEVAYFSARGQSIWSEPRGMDAGYHWPQYSIHRGALQMLLFRTLVDRAGAGVIQTGAALTGWDEDRHGVWVHLANRKSGTALDDVHGEVLIACDGINSVARARLYPDEGAAVWSGTMMWRGVTDGPRFLTGRSMAMAGRSAQKFVCYPMQDHGDGRMRINWIADLALPPDSDWTREGRLSDFAPAFADWQFDWLNIPWLIHHADRIWEFPMVDRDPLPAWSFGRVTLLGDAAHAMYPIGSNGASQAILDARVLTRELLRHGRGAAALQAYEADRRETVNALVLATRGDGPDTVLDIVAERAPDGFGKIDDVMSAADLRDVAARYKSVAGFDIDILNARAPLIEF